MRDGAYIRQNIWNTCGAFKRGMALPSRLAWLLLFLAACTSIEQRTALTEIQNQYALEELKIQVSFMQSRSNPLPLNGATLYGRVHIFVPQYRHLVEVRFYLNDPKRRSRPFKVDRKAPFDFNGGTSKASNAWSTMKIADGKHTITAVLINKRGGRATIQNAIFTVSNIASQPIDNMSIALGAYISGAPWDPTKIDEFATMVGTMPSVVMWYQDWANSGAREFDPNKMDAVVSRGAVPMVTWDPWDYTAGVSQPEYALWTILAGHHDDYIRQWSRDASAWGGQMYLRFAHEMNGNWYPWSTGINGNTGAAEYIAVWIYIHDIFNQEGAKNVRWVWSPNIAFNGSTPFENVYPGDAYVDWIGLDGYNWGTTQPDKNWEGFAAIMSSSYHTLSAMTEKPIMITETSSAELGGDKAAWIRKGLMDELPEKFPRVQAVIWFNEDKETDWRINSSPAALEAYSQVASSSLYQGRLP